MQSGGVILQLRRHHPFDVVETTERMTRDLETEWIGDALQRAEFDGLRESETAIRLLHANHSPMTERKNPGVSTGASPVSVFRDQKLRWARSCSSTVSWSLNSYRVRGFGADGPSGAAPVNFWSRWNHWTSAEKVRFLTGVQRVTTPSCETLKSGLQL